MPTHWFGQHSLLRGEPTAPGSVAGARPRAAGRAAACLATVLGHTEELPAAACCPHVPLGRKDCAGGEGTNAQTYCALTVPTAAAAQ